MSDYHKTGDGNLAALDRYLKEQDEGSQMVEDFEHDISHLVDELSELEKLQQMIFKTIDSEDDQEKMVSVLMEQAYGIYDEIYGMASSKEWDAWEVAVAMIKDEAKELELV